MALKLNNYKVPKGFYRQMLVIFSSVAMNYYNRYYITLELGISETEIRTGNRRYVAGFSYKINIMRLF